MPSDRPTTRLRILPELARGNRPTLTVVGLLALVSAAATLVLPMLSAALIEALQTHADVTSWGLGIVGLGVVATLTGAASAYLLSRTAQGMVLRLRTRTMEHTVRARVREAQRLGAGDLATRLTSDAARVQSAAEVSAVHLPLAVVTLLGTVVVMAVLDWVLLLVALAALALAFAAVGTVVVALKRRYVALQRAVGGVSQSFTDTLDGLPIVKAYQAEEHVLTALRQQADDVRTAELGVARLQSLLAPVLTLGQQIALVSVLVGGGVRLVDGDLSLAAFVAFLMYLLQLASPLMAVVTGVAQVQAGLAARERYDEVFSLEPEDAADPDPALPVAPAGHGEPAVTFRGVDFSHDTQPTLRSVDLDVPARGLTALVGVSGAGKSTVLALIEGFVTPSGGRVRVLGRDRADWRLADLRARLGYVDQRFTLVAGTLRANLTLGLRTGVGDDALFTVLDRVALGDAVRSMPAGLDTRIGNGADLSGGQRQRLALARMMLLDPALVLLDEPTSQLDPLSETRFHGVVDELAGDRAVLVVAHRMSTVQRADHVIVMDEGRVLAQGSHHQLAQECTPYAALLAGRLSSPVPSLV